LTSDRALELIARFIKIECRIKCLVAYIDTNGVSFAVASKANLNAQRSEPPGPEKICIMI
jgi:hypothetical protein